MKKLLLLTFAMLVAGSMPAMQQQKQKEEQEQQQQKKKDKKKPNNHDNNQPEQPETDPAVDNLKAMLSTIMNQINQEHGSATNMVENLKHKEHTRICPTCGGLAAHCPADRSRIAGGTVLLCGCPICGGLLV
jgi:hypothetical protein